MIDPLPLKGVRVLDASRVLAGPLCGQMLGDLGAEVIKIERPDRGDETREWGPPFVGDLSAYFLSCNRNKRSLTLNLAEPRGRELLHQIAKKSDVLLENFLPHSAERLGVSPADLHAVNPKLVICSISGFGRTGPMRDVPGYDFAIQALSGLMSITGPKEGPPSKVGVAVTDVLTGLYATIGVLACLRARERSGHGYAIDLALLDCAIAAQVNVAQAYLSSGELPPRQGNAHLQIVPYQLFPTKDGWIVLAVGNDGQWRRFCEVAERSELAEDERFRTNPLRVENREELVPIIEKIMRQRSTKKWREILTEANVPHAPVRSYADLFSEEQTKARGMRVTITDPQGKPVDLLGSPFHLDGEQLPAPSAPPELGGQTEEILKEVLGLSSEEIASLRKETIV